MSERLRSDWREGRFLQGGAVSFHHHAAEQSMPDELVFVLSDEADENVSVRVERPGTRRGSPRRLPGGFSRSLRDRSSMQGVFVEAGEAWFLDDE